LHARRKAPAHRLTLRKACDSSRRVSPPQRGGDIEALSIGRVRRGEPTVGELIKTRTSIKHDAIDGVVEY